MCPSHIENTDKRTTNTLHRTSETLSSSCMEDEEEAGEEVEECERPHQEQVGWWRGGGGRAESP